MKILLAFGCLLLGLGVSGHAAAWEKQLTSKPGPVPLPPRPYSADYTFGWSGFSAGEAHVHVGDRSGETVGAQASGRSTGLARALWRLDATHSAVANATTLNPVQAKQREVYRGKTLETTLRFSGDRVERSRQSIPEDKAVSVKRFKYPDPTDLYSAFLHLRSQRMNVGDTYRLVVYPATAAYLATIKVTGKEKIKVQAGSFNALKCDLGLQRINDKLKLEPHTKFKRATAWISDDQDRVVLRIEADIFVGSVWCELQKITFENPRPVAEELGDDGDPAGVLR